MIRLTDLGKNLTQKDDAENQKNNIIIEQPFNEVDVKNTLSIYATSIKDTNMFLANILENIVFEIIDKETIELHFANKVNEDAFNNNKTDIITFLRNNLKNSNINITSKIDETCIVKRPYTDKEKLQAMIEKNKNIKYLKNKLKLETDF